MWRSGQRERECSFASGSGAKSEGVAASGALPSRPSLDTEFINAGLRSRLQRMHNPGMRNDNGTRCASDATPQRPAIASHSSSVIPARATELPVLRGLANDADGAAGR
jgi:hypothetical protein